jgi:hypothetical protein
MLQKMFPDSTAFHKNWALQTKPKLNNPKLPQFQTIFVADETSPRPIECAPVQFFLEFMSLNIPRERSFVGANTGCFKGQHNGEGEIGQQYIQGLIRARELTVLTVWDAFLGLSQVEENPMMTPEALAAEEPHHISRRHHVYICEEGSATQEQRDRARTTGDVLILDLMKDWLGATIPSHKEQFCFRAQQTGDSFEDRAAAGDVLSLLVLLVRRLCS